MSVDSSFIFKNKLNVHVKNVHERRHQQVCHICAKISTTKQGMLEHLKEHDGVKEPGVSCEFCGKLYKNKYLARKHAKNMHQQHGTLHKCPQCQKHLATSTALRHHISYHHNFKLHKCDVCDKAFKIAKALNVSFGAWSNMIPVLNESFFGAGSHGNTHGSRFVQLRFLPQNVQSKWKYVLTLQANASG